LTDHDVFLVFSKHAQDALDEAIREAADAEAEAAKAMTLKHPSET